MEATHFGPAEIMILFVLLHFPASAPYLLLLGTLTWLLF